MGDPVAIWLLLGSFFFLILIGIDIAFAIGFSTIATTLYLGLPLQSVAMNMVRGINVFSLMAVPFFIVAGEIMGSGGISKRLVYTSKTLVGWLRGSLAMVNVLASMFFGGISGSAAADTSALGSMLIPMMKKDGYDADFSTAVTLSSSVQGILIPPSHNMVIYALAAGSVSIGRLFLGGMVPGILLGIALMVYSYFVAVRRGYPVGDRFNLLRAVKSFFSSFWGLGTVAIVVVGVVVGVFTATESAAIAVLYACLITFFVYREIPLKNIFGILYRSVRTLSVVMIVVAMATAFGWLISYLQIPKILSEVIFSFSTNKIIILIIMNILLLFLGAFLNMVSIILIMTPILLPIVQTIGVDPVHFGVIMILNLGIGLITPPIGTVLYIGSAVSGLSIEKITKSLLPFYGVMLLVLILVTYVPEIVMFFPDLLMPLN